MMMVVKTDQVKSLQKTSTCAAGPLNPHSGWCSGYCPYQAHVTEEETEAQRGKFTFPSHTGSGIARTYQAGLPIPGSYPLRFGPFTDEDSEAQGTICPHSPFS